jgi:hypothetical protein
MKTINLVEEFRLRLPVSIGFHLWLQVFSFTHPPVARAVPEEV